MRRQPQKSRAGHDRWLVSYADFITLLFGLFVVLYAFARADQKKQAQIPAAIDSAFHAMGFPLGARENAGRGSKNDDLSTDIVMAEQVREPAAVKQDLERIERELTRTLSGAVAAHTVSITMSRDGLVISLREAGFFDSGSATVKPQAIENLRQIATSVGRAPYDVRVEGHTDNVPIHNPEFDSNWELSGARAMGIAKLFLNWQAMAPERLSAAGYGEFHPVASNATDDGRAQNRRVDLVVLPRTSIDFSAPSAPEGQGNWRRVTEGDQ